MIHTFKWTQDDCENMVTTTNDKQFKEQKALMKKAKITDYEVEEVHHSEKE